MRRLFAALLSVFVLLIVLPGAGLAEPPIKVLVDDDAVVFDAQPFMENDRTLVPVRALSEKLGFTVGWDEAEQKVTLTKDDMVIGLWVGSNKVLVKGKETTIDVPAKKVGDRVFVPVRFVSEQLGTHVSWNGQTNSVAVTSGNGLLKQVSSQQSQLIDQKMTFDMTLTMSGQNPQTGEMESLNIPLSMEVQVYQGDMLMTMKTDMAGFAPGLGAMTVRVAGKGGTMYVEDPTTHEWKVAGQYDPKLGMNQPGLAESMRAGGMLQLQESYLKVAQVRIAGVEELNGIKVVKVEADLSKVDFQGLLAQLGSMSALPPGAAGSLKMKADQFKVTYWFDTESKFLYKALIDLSLTMSAEGENITMAMKGEMNAQPMIEPIQFPALPQPFAFPTVPATTGNP